MDRDSNSEDSEGFLHDTKLKVEQVEEIVYEEEAILNKESSKNKVFLRIFCGFATLLCLWLMICNLIFMVVSLVPASLYLFQKPSLNAITKRFWGIFKASITCAVGFTMAIFNLPLGIGMLMLYISLQNEISSPIMKALLKKVTDKL